ncbi:YkvA family protein [Mycolicibacterium hodleri]|uniref:DUF1232 domain-containing protein n=1 Tax=Mycolicibacterium hodleri TaxID=49897 RepID=A0A502E8I6_9MYCO|nr:DUF1232 domain-containing protein [Mycolicibacterium hodleri]TPG32751.1 DUF1232 domain-containing protein [Mycolicibacterium hodleri]
MGLHWWSIPLGIISGSIVLWVALVAALWSAKPDDVGLRDVARLLPDLLRLLKRLATDPSAPRGVRIRVGLLLVYLALPIDLIPDFIPVIGYADDAVIVAIVLRSIARVAGSGKLAEHWPGSPEGLDALMRLCRLGERPGR